MSKDISEEILKSCTRKVLFARARLLQKNGFYGLLLMHMKFSISSECKNATANNDYLVFNPDFLMQLSDFETEYMLMHLVTHVALQHYSRADGLNRKLFFEACDIVVNSNILKSNNMDLTSISIELEGGIQPHLAPDGTEGFLHSACEIYEMLLFKCENKASDDTEGTNYSDNGDISLDKTSFTGWDEHNSDCLKSCASAYIEDEWRYRILEAIEKTERRNSILKSEGSKQCGEIPAFFERILQEKREHLVNWRTVLNEFIQEEVKDYSFSPPDRRYNDSPFFLPDYNETDERLRDILFMVDTSGSMNDELVSDCYYEIKSAIEQYDGKLEGWLGFFDAEVKSPKAFSDDEEFSVNIPKGGGGTNFACIFEYINLHMSEYAPACIVILTDGYANFPEESVSNGIPVLWIICNIEVIPPWGKYIRMGYK